MRSSICLIAVFLLSGLVNANYTLAVTCYDYNTNQTLSDVALYLNTTSNITNAVGRAEFYGNGSQVLNATKSGYHFYSTDVMLSGNLSKDLRLYPSSSDGFFRDRLVDMTLGLSNVTVCLYYASNDRLHGCYQEGDNITTNENINYTMRVLMRRTDAVMNVNTFGPVMYSYGFPFLIFIILLAFSYRMVIRK